MISALSVGAGCCGSVSPGETFVRQPFRNESRFLMLKSALTVVIVAVVAACAFSFQVNQSMSDLRNLAQKQMREGNYREAYESFRKLALEAENDPRAVGTDLTSGIQCLHQLGRIDEVDEFREEVLEVHGENWRLLQSAAASFMNGPHFGYLVAGKFYRGDKRGGGQAVGTTERDRVRALQLMQTAMSLVDDDVSQRDRSNLYLNFAAYFLGQRGEAWRLQDLTDLNELPDYEEAAMGFRFGYYSPRASQTGAPVDSEGNPVFHHLPESYETAQSDGERWRWMLHQAAQVEPTRKDQIRLQFAGFLYGQFGVQTVRSYQPLFRSSGDDDDESGPYAVHTLEENETIARLATGVKRFTLPDEFNFLEIYRDVAKLKSGYGQQALEQLAQIFENRRQYPKAAEIWRDTIERFGPGNRNYRRDRLQQIVGNWGRFESSTVQPARTGATVDFRFRNGESVSFEAHRIRIDTLLEDVKSYLKSNPQRLDWENLNIENIGHRLVVQGQRKYLADRVANWTVDLQPRENHFDRIETITTPLQQAGAYLLVANMADGNTSRTIVWVSDTVIVRKSLDGATYHYIADAVTGEPIADAKVEFFGYRQRHLGGNRFVVDTSQFAEFADIDGQVIPDANDFDPNYQWLAMARTKGGRLAYLGFGRLWHGRMYDQQYHQNKVFVITDRPVYRPGQTVKFKFWIGQAQYDNEERSLFADQDFTIVLSDAQGNNVFEKEYHSDQFGGFAGEYELPDDAKLGQYRLRLDINKSRLKVALRTSPQGDGTFRVEEYKKPEYEVTVDAPDKPVELGETITATIRANYYFGAPVTEARVHYKVQRTSETTNWYPRGDWDWLYGNGYWWFGCDCAWYPGWSRWGISRPIPIWWGHRPEPPELVLENEVSIGPDGTVEIEIDTALAKELHGDVDHRYQITAEVVDQSRRTIVGTGSVLVTRQPFQVYAWVDRGHYRVGDTIEANFLAQTGDHNPVEGKGKLQLLKITYDADATPIETVVQEWDLDTNDRGEASVQMQASAAGQYRLSYTVTDSEGHVIEGGYLLTVRGAGFDGADYQFSDIELIADKREYRPGETVRLMINSNRAGGTVVLFVRPTNGTYLPPRIVRLDGKSTVEEIEVTRSDMPNFFVEAFTITGGKIASETREIVVPPEKRVVNVEVEPSQEEFQPGADAKVQVKLTDINGEPFVGSIVLSMYDKSVEYISGGSNVGDIKEFFWKWRRNHYPRTMSNLDRYFGNVLRRGEITMRNVGIFGELIIELADKRKSDSSSRDLGINRRMAPQSGLAGGAVMEFADDAEGAAMPMAAAAGNFAGAESPDMAEPVVRTQFADTAYWNGAITADENGYAEVALVMPENLTGWRIRAWAMGEGTNVGEGDANVVTTKNLLLRLQSPRFFVERDEVVLSANVHNYLETAKQAQVVLELDGGALQPLDGLTQTVQIAAGGEARVDWRVKAVEPGDAIIRMKALTDEESDAMEMTFPVNVHGMLKTDSYTGVLRPNDQSNAVTVTVPSERREEETRLEIRYSPTLAGAMVDALPYLVEYPYGCTEQTLNRFLPTVITQNILLRMNLDLEDIRNKRTNLNAQEIGDPVERAERWKRYKRNPVYDEGEVLRMVKDGVKRLTEMQVSDGGWGWFSGYGERSYPHTTAVVVHGLQLASANEVAIVPGVLERGVQWLTRYQEEQVQRLKNAATETKPYKTQADNLDAFVFMVLVDANIVSRETLDFLYRDRTHLSVYAKGMFGIALHALEEDDKLAMIVRNIDQFLVEDEENETAYLKLPAGSYWWYWYGSEIEANAYYLKLLSRTAPESRKASRLVKYLLNNRRHATYWNSTRDTAVCIEALAEYLVASGEAEPDMNVQILVDGKVHHEMHITTENLMTFDNQLVLAGEELASGPHRIEFRKVGRGPLYFNAYLTNFTLEEYITKAGLEIKVNRKYYQLVRKDDTEIVPGSRGQVIDQQVEKYDRVELPNLSSLTSGDLVEIELEIDSKNDYEYLIFEDMKAAGFEPVDLRSGYTGNEMRAYVEFRDERVAFFVRHLARGKHSVSYRMRAEIPGRFSALPTRASAMYAPELRANSDEIKLVIGD